MNTQKAKRDRYLRRRNRVRAQISGTADRPRLSVFRSRKYLEAQLIDDVSGKTILGMSDRTVKAKGTKTDRATAFGEAFAKAAKKSGVETVVFDRNGRTYHGRLKAFADAARNQGLNF